MASKVVYGLHVRSGDVTYYFTRMSSRGNERDTPENGLFLCLAYFRVLASGSHTCIKILKYSFLLSVRGGLSPMCVFFLSILTRELTPRTVRVLCEKFCLMNCFYARVLAVIVFLLTC